MLYTASAWALECRDKWIGWTYKQKERNLYRIINQSRFLILPWIQIKNLASHVLSLSIKQIGEDWQERFGYKPVLIETFVDPEKFKGVCYQASNWTHIGKTRVVEDRTDIQRGCPRSRIFMCIYWMPTFERSWPDDEDGKTQDTDGRKEGTKEGPTQSPY